MPINVVEMWGHDFKEAEKHPGFLMGLLKRRSALVCEPCA
jgi:hypothetical protein